MFSVLLAFCITVVVLVECQTDLFADVSTTNNTEMMTAARGGYSSGGGGYGSHDSYGSNHGHGVSTDPVSILGLLSLGGLLLRSILNVLNNSARSLDVEDINLPLQLSDLPENWKGLTHVIYERSLEDDEPSSDDDPIQKYLILLRTDRNCVGQFLCDYWTANDDSFLDILMLSTARLLGEPESAAVYDSKKTPGRESTVDRYCSRARAKCPPGKSVKNELKTL